MNDCRSIHNIIIEKWIPVLYFYLLGSDYVKNKEYCSREQLDLNKTMVLIRSSLLMIHSASTNKTNKTYIKESRTRIR
jgi:hypothetical protein